MTETKTPEQLAEEWYDKKYDNCTKFRNLEVLDAYLAGYTAARRWIPVEEGLPEDKNDVVVRCVDKNYGSEQREILLHHLTLVGQYHEGYGWLVHKSDDWFGPIEVIEWLPLPGTYK